MILGLIFWCGFGWHVIGIIIMAFISCNEGSPTHWTEGLDWLSYKWLYENYPYNRIGTTILFVFYNLLMPLVSIGYWLYRLFNFLFIDEIK